MLEDFYGFQKKINAGYEIPPIEIKFENHCHEGSLNRLGKWTGHLWMKTPHSNCAYFPILRKFPHPKDAV